MIIQLTDLDSGKVYININNIVCFSWVHSHTSVCLVGDKTLPVKESPDYISSKINEWSKKTLGL